MATFGLICAILGMAGATAWLAMDTADGFRRGRCDTLLFGTVSRSRMALFRFMVIVRTVAIGVAGTAVLGLIWLAFVSPQAMSPS